MFKKVSILALIILILVTFTGCLPPFVDGGITATDYFEDTVKYTTFDIDAGEENGFVESNIAELSLEDLLDGDEKNVLFRSYRSIVFTTKEEGVELTSLAYIVQSEADCVICFTIFYGEDIIVSDTVSLKENTISTLYFSEFSLMLEKDKELKILISNPLEVGTVAFRTDSYIFIGQEVENV